MHDNTNNNNNSSNNNDHRQCKVDCLDDIVGGIGLAYTYSNDSAGNNKNNKTCTNKSTNHSSTETNKCNNNGLITNCILLRCRNDELDETLKKCFIIGYFRKWNTKEHIEVPPPNS